MKIMVGYDGTQASIKAVDLAISHAKAFDGQIVAVASMDKGTEDELESINQLEQALQKLKSDIEDQGPACETHLLIRGMDPGEDLVRYAREQKIDEIILAVQRKSKVGKLIFGSTAQHVILNAPCPVVTVT
jgi:nucleotide-binding universal stress UspA family protein